MTGETGKGTAKTMFSIAVDRGFGENKQTDWFFITIYGKPAEAAAKVLVKGSLVAIDGRVETYKKEDGTTGFVVVSQDWQVLSSKKEGSGKRSDAEEEASSPDATDADPDDLPF